MSVSSTSTSPLQSNMSKPVKILKRPKHTQSQSPIIPITSKVINNNNNTQINQQQNNINNHTDNSEMIKQSSLGSSIHDEGIIKNMFMFSSQFRIVIL